MFLVVRTLTRFSSRSLEIFAFFMLTGIFSTLLLPETMGKTLESLNGEEDIEDDYAAGHEKVIEDNSSGSNGHGRKKATDVE